MEADRSTRSSATTADWSIEDPRYIPQNLPLLLAGLPDILPACALRAPSAELFDPDLPGHRRRGDVGMSLLLDEPGLPAGARRRCAGSVASDS